MTWRFEATRGSNHLGGDITVPNRPRRRLRGARRDPDADIFERFQRSPLDPWNSRLFSAAIYRRIVANPPRSGSGRIFAYLLVLQFLLIGVFVVLSSASFVTLGLVALMVLVGVVLLARLRRSRPRQRHRR